MTHNEKINYMRMATALCGFGIDVKHLDLLVSTYELILEKGGNADMQDCANVQALVEAREIDKKRIPVVKKKKK
jgi:hypothetical protein